jgi:3-hydroxyacyl-[acyl-carrier-protein] dehydratase
VKKNDEWQVTGNEKPESPRPSVFIDDFLGLPHRPPFVFVQHLVACVPGRSAECESTFSPDDAIFAGHFPGDPLVPGVILTEALAQTAGIAAASSAQAGKPQPRFLLSAIRKMKFSRAVRPGERIIFRAERVATMDGLWQFQVQACVDNQSVATGDLVLSPDRSG